MSANEKTKTELQFEAVTSYMKDKPDVTVRQACNAVAVELKTTPGAVAQAYYAQRAKNQGRPLRRRTRVAQYAARPMHEVLSNLQKAANDLATAQEAFQVTLEETNNALHAYEEDLKARNDGLDNRERHIASVEKALAALQGR